MTWILIHNEDDQGKQAKTRANNAGLTYVEVVMTGGPDTAHDAIANVKTGQKVIYSGHGSNGKTRFLTSKGNTIKPENFATLLGMTEPTRVVLLSCFGGEIVKNNLKTFQEIEGLKNCIIEGPTVKLMGAQIQEEMKKLQKDPSYHPYKATGFMITL